jgi:hypothetical protein
MVEVISRNAVRKFGPVPATDNLPTIIIQEGENTD